MPLYFAYGANMDVAAMVQRAPHSKPLGAARLARHRFIITQSGYASAVRDPRREVYGLLWDLSLADIGALDRFEGRFYERIDQPVITFGGAKRALLYVATSNATGQPKSGYLETILQAAAALDFPEPYRRELAGWKTNPAQSADKTAPRASDWEWDD